MKMVSVVGARPQFIKLAVVSRAVRKHNTALAGTGNDLINDVIVHTGQHFDQTMSQVFFDELGIAPPQHNLGIDSLSHGAMTGRMLMSIEQVLMDERPDWVVVYGDTNSTLAGALAAAKLNLDLAHVEAGVRSFDQRMPEEVNRKLTDHAADLLLCPSPAAMDNLESEGLGLGPDLRDAEPSDVDGLYQPSTEPLAVLVGDVMYDAALYQARRARAQSNILATLGLQPEAYCLATVHRQENTDDPQCLRAIFAALVRLSEEMPLVLPLHPRTRKQLATQGLLQVAQSKLMLVEPVGYRDMAALEKNAALILTDSGGVQREAFFHATPCLTLRDTTEWVELLGPANRLVAADEEAIVLAAKDALNGGPVVSRTQGPYGDGRAGEKIVSLLLAHGAGEPIPTA